ncbi:hypothetical protein AN1537.2 [Aspergillus nidulans FGSC A4]|nr:hypothetical protein AN1537.2 [Aspergillus nidulans FGSC A4]|eukprot:XP_659141.1 hypothetical protein AN1537.2 [Aspergillus nidulans FGSC A4]
MSEDQDLMARISQLAGQINRFKNGNTPVQSAHNEMHSNSHVSRHTSYRGRPGWAPYRGRPYGRGRGAAPHRHRTLILNNSATPASKSSTPPDGMAIDTDENSRSATPNAWVTKHARHMQLINSAVYDKEAQKRVKALEETRKAKAQKKAQIEQAKVLQFAHGAGRQFSSSSNPQVSAAGESHGEYQITLNDIPFRVSRGGGKLIRVSSATPVLSALIERAGLQIVDDPNTANNTPKRVKVAGVTFVRSKNGNLHRLGASALGGQEKGRALPKIHYDGYQFFPQALRIPFVNCSPSQVQRVMLTDISSRSPACVHFLRGRCSNPECRYAHVRVTPGAPVCRAFATLGYCDKGETCEERHVHECPDYANTGVCKKKHCRLPHVDRAGQIRKNAGPKEGEGDDESDASSEEEEFDEIGSDDVDSDYLSDEGELIEGTETGEVSKQQDFIRL